jgi:NTE family protein
MGQKSLDLALQGGGAHGAYTWGILDRLLDDEEIAIDGVCGTSAGAMNGVCLIYGMAKGGRAGAKELLHKFWQEISEAGKYSMLKPSYYDRSKSKGNMNYSPGYRFFSFLTDNISPHHLNPAKYNPLEAVLKKLIDFEELQRISPPRLFVCATNVLTCEARVFGPNEISAKSLLASACLPYLFPAVEIDGQYYWDGGYMGNPPLYPLVDNTPDTNDILLVQINPIQLSKVPETMEEIRDRVNEISFNSSLINELKTIKLRQELAAKGVHLDENHDPIYLHHLSADKDLDDLNLSSKMNTEWEYLCYLRDTGRKAADAWIKENKRYIGVKSTFQI